MHLGGKDRARWLAELAETLERARAILDGLATTSASSEDQAAVADQLRQAIVEVDALRRGRRWPVGTAFDPDWTKLRRDRPDRGS